MQAMLDDYAWRMRGGDGFNYQAEDVDEDRYLEAFHPDPEQVPVVEFGLGAPVVPPHGGAQLQVHHHLVIGKQQLLCLVSLSSVAQAHGCALVGQIPSTREALSPYCKQLTDLVQ